MLIWIILLVWCYFTIEARAKELWLCVLWDREAKRTGMMIMSLLFFGISLGAAATVVALPIIQLSSQH